MKKNKKIKTKVLLVLLLLLISVGYALLSTEISIKGTGKIKNAKWDIHLENIQVTEGSVEPITGASIDQNRTGVLYSVGLNVPGDYYEFTVDVVNSGTIDGMIDSVLSQVKINDGEFVDFNSSSIPSYLNYTVQFINGSFIMPKYQLKASERETYKIRIEFKKDIEEDDLPLEEENLEFSFVVNYVQKDSTSVSIPQLEVGKYISLTPDKASFTISKDDTGYYDDQTITPNELNLWRIIRVNEDGTYDAISEYVSSNDIYFKGVTGYANLIQNMQTLANQYQKSGYTTKARIFGYDSQTLSISDTSYFDGTNNNPITDHSSGKDETGIGQEYENGVAGDTLYLSDYQMVKDVYQGKLKTSKVNNLGTMAPYWLCSRSFNYTSDTYYNYGSRFITQTGTIDYTGAFRSYMNKWQDASKGYALRPIITIKGNIGIINGLGDLEHPYTLA